MATTSAASNRLTLELGGVSAGPLRSALPPSYRIERSAAASPRAKAAAPRTRVTLGELAADADLSTDGPLVAWLNTLMAGKPKAMDGVVQVLDYRWIERRRFEFSEALLTEIRPPPLSATDKQPITLALKWRAARVASSPGSGRVIKGAAGGPKALMRANFRVQGLPCGAKFVSRVELPSVSLRAADGNDPIKGRPQVDIGELVLGFGARATDEVLGWVQQQIEGDAPGGALLPVLAVEILDAALKTVLATWTLSGCSLRACDEARIGPASEAPGGVSLRFAVGQVLLTVAG
jgi:hypothetical protein